MDNLENLAHLVSRMSLHEDIRNQASGTGFMLEVSEVNIPEFIGVDDKNEIVPVLDNPENAVAKQDRVALSRNITETRCQFKISTILKNVSRITRRISQNLVLSMTSCIL